MDGKRKELNTFRKQWMDELNKHEELGKKRKTALIPNKNDKNVVVDNDETCQQSIVNKYESKQSNTSIKLKRNTKDVNEIHGKTLKSPGGFDIANKYLMESTSNCQYCANDKKTYQELHNRKESEFFKRDNANSENDKEFDPHVRPPLVDLLIADIDEINSIPFFDLELPKEIAVQIFQYLSLSELMKCTEVNTKWKALAEDNLIWYSIYSKLDLDVIQKVADIDEIENWKEYVKLCVIETRSKERKWKERICQVNELANEKGGIICAADLTKHFAAVAYIDGSIRMWDLSTGKYGRHLKERYTNDEEIVLAMCTAIKLSSQLCVAGFKNGNIMVWKVEDDLTNQFVFMSNYDNCEIEKLYIGLASKSIGIQLHHRFIIISENVLDQDKSATWNWNTIYESSCEKVLHRRMIEECNAPLRLVTATRSKLDVLTVLENSVVILDELIGASFSCVDYKHNYMVAAIESVGFSVLDGYRIRKYNVVTGRLVANVVGSQTLVTCMNYKDCHGDTVLIGCSDHTIRIHDLKKESLTLTISGVNSSITTLQMDRWKIVSGHQDGTVCLWDCKNGIRYWQTNTRHPVRICHFNDTLLMCVNIPLDKSPQNSYWNVDDLIQRKKYRGSIRVMDFSKDAYDIGVSEEFRANYDNITGYDYNIELIAPYDDINYLNLPKI